MALAGPQTDAGRWSRIPAAAVAGAALLMGALTVGLQGCSSRALSSWSDRRADVDRLLVGVSIPGSATNPEERRTENRRS